MQDEVPVRVEDDPGPDGGPRIEAASDGDPARVKRGGQNPGVERVLMAVNAATGWGLAVDDLMDAGKRIVTLKRLLNQRRGLTRADDRLPGLLLRSLEDGGTEGRVPDLGALLAGAYAEFGWDPATGEPGVEAVEALGL